VNRAAALNTVALRGEPEASRSRDSEIEDPIPDTIVAVATPPGAGAIGMIRVSGPQALVVVQEVVRPRSGTLDAQRPAVLRRADIVDPAHGEILDEALCAVMRRPRSYTGEDLIEICCHGSPVVLRRVLDLIVRAGARIAQPGEFTKRAFLNGRMNLAEAEAVIQIISARTARAAALAARALRGDLSRKVDALREALLDVIAGLEVALDFPDDGVGVTVAAAAQDIRDLARSARRLVDAARAGQVIHGGLSVVIVGSPNAGKSSLLNALLESDRAIVSPEAGTTRDLVDGTIDLDGVPVRLVDTAGLREPVGVLEAEGMRRTRRAMSDSDLCLVVVDGSLAVDAPAISAAAELEHVVVINKIDLRGHPDWASVVGVRVSALTGEGLGELKATLSSWVCRRLALDGDEGGLVATARQVCLLEEITRDFDQSVAAIESDAPIEAVLVPLRGALSGCDDVLGVDVDDAVLDRIFSRFCVGK